MCMYIAVPSEFDPVIEPTKSFDEMDEAEIRHLWKVSYETIDERTLNF